MPTFDESDLRALLSSTLFAGVTTEQARAMLDCLGARRVDFDADEIIFHIGDKIPALGVVLSGSVLVGSEDYWGNSNIIAHVEAGEMFAEAFACLPSEPSTVRATAATACRIGFLDVHRILSSCSSTCTFHHSIAQNLMRVLARRNLALTRKVEHVTKRTTEEKVLAYLHTLSQKTQSNEVEIPFNRQQLADYLAVERSALSSCLSKMQRQGIISFHKNHFTLIS